MVDDPRQRLIVEERRKDELLQIRNVLHDIATTVDVIQKSQVKSEENQQTIQRILRGDEADVEKPGLLARVRDVESSVALLQKLVYGLLGAVALELVHIIPQLLNKS